MANEITIQSKLTATKGGSSVTNYTSDFTISMNTALTKMANLVQGVGTVREAVEVGDVDITNATGDEYWIRLTNNDSTNFVTVEVRTGASTYMVVGKMYAGETWGPARLPKLDASGYNGIYLTADTAACDVDVTICEAGDPAS